MRGLYAVLDLIFYGNFWIAGCAFAMSAMTQRLLGATSIWTPENLLVFGGTLFIYGVHRSVGISRLKTFLKEKRYGVIYKFRNHIKIYSILGLILAGFNFFQLSRLAQISMIIPCLLSLGYVLPMLGGNKRLRDINDLKIFLIAICWAGLTVGIPAIELNQLQNPIVYWLLLERGLFIFLITLPFDIRDLKVDSYKSVKTLPFRLGEARTRQLGLGICILLCGLAIMAFYLQFISLAILIILMISYLAALWALWMSHSEKHDYFYTGLVDGLMLLQALPLLFFI